MFTEEEPACCKLWTCANPLVGTRPVFWVEWESHSSFDGLFPDAFEFFAP